MPNKYRVSSQEQAWVGWGHLCSSYWYIIVFMVILFCLVVITLVMYTMCGQEGEVGPRSEENLKNGCKYYRKEITNDAKVNEVSNCDIAFAVIIVLCFVIVFLTFSMSILL